MATTTPTRSHISVFQFFRNEIRFNRLRELRKLLNAPGLDPDGTFTTRTIECASGRALRFSTRCLDGTLTGRHKAFNGREPRKLRFVAGTTSTDSSAPVRSGS